MMRFGLLSLMTAFFFIHFSPAYAGKIEHDFATAFINTSQYIEENQAIIWPGFHLDTHPVILNIFSDDHDDIYYAYAFQFTPKNAEWKRLLIENTPIYYRNNVSYYRDDHSLFYFDKIEDQSSLVAIVLPYMYKKPDLYVSWLVDTLFQDYVSTGSHFPKASVNPSNFVYDGFHDMNNIALAKIEREILRDYLSNLDIEALKNYLALHQIRKQALNPESSAFENALELLKGTSTYVSVKSFMRTKEAYRNHVLSLYPEPIYACGYLDEYGDIRSCLIHKHYDYIDAVLGYAVDTIPNFNWKASAERNGESLSTVLSRYYAMSQTEIGERTKTAKKHYQYDDKMTAIETKLKTRLIQIQDAASAYQQLPGTEIKVDITGCYIDFNSLHVDKWYILNSRSELLTSVSEHFDCNRNTKGRTVNIDKLPSFLLDYNQYDYFIYGGLPDYVRWKISNDTSLILDGLQETVGSFIKASKKTKFHNLRIQNNNVLLEMKDVEGTLDGTGNTLIMTLFTADSKR